MYPKHTQYILLISWIEYDSGKCGKQIDSYYELLVYQHPVHQHYIDEWMRCYTPSYQHCGPPHKLLCRGGLFVCCEKWWVVPARAACVNPVLRWLTVIDGDDRETPASSPTCLNESV